MCPVCTEALDSTYPCLLIVIERHTYDAKAYHQLAQAYLKCEKGDMAEAMLDSMYALLSGSPTYIKLDYQPILNHYLKGKKQNKVEQYVQLMLKEQQAFKEKELKFNLVESIVDLQTEQKQQELQILKLKQANQRLWILVGIALFIITIVGAAALLSHQKRQYKAQMNKANEMLASLTQKLNESNAEKDKREQEIREFLKDKDNRQ